MGRYIVETIKEQVLAPDTPEFVLMHREDIVLLLEIIDCADEMGTVLESYPKNRFVKRILEIWNELMRHEV